MQYNIAETENTGKADKESQKNVTAQSSVTNRRKQRQIMC